MIKLRKNFIKIFQSPVRNFSMIIMYKTKKIKKSIFKKMISEKLFNKLKKVAMMMIDNKLQINEISHRPSKS